MPQKIDNSSVRRKSAKPSVDEEQDGEQRGENSVGKKEDPHYDVVSRETPVPKILTVEGLTLVETDLPVLQGKTRADNNNNDSGGSDMKKLSRKKVSDESSLEESKPLKISARKPGKKRAEEKMEDESKMDDVDLGDEDEENASSPVKESGNQHNKGKVNNKAITPAVETAVSAFADAKKNKNGRYDQNKNAPTDDKGKGEATRKGSGDAELRSKPKPFHISNGEEGRADSFEIATKDDVDAGSVYSLYMQKDFRYHFQHPYFRLFTAYFVTFCNFLIYAEDPVAHSRSECNIPVIGNDFSFVCMKYLPNAWSLLKVFLWLTGTLIGIIVGKLIFHSWLFNRVLRLKMFHDDKGSWMTMFLSTILFVFIFSYIYNLFLLAGGDYTEPYKISPYMGLSNSIFMKAAATGTWCGDFFTAWMVTDMMLQEKLYPDWAKPVRKWWNTGYRRIILFWVVVAVSSFIVLFVIATDYINWDSLNRDFLHTNEISRAFLASFILVMDITIVMQDWDFPHFIGAIDIKLPGINTAHIRFKIPKLFRKLEHWQIHISGKWFNYGILFVVILLDLNMWKNQIFYSPYDYGQYVDADGRIHTVEDQFSLDHANESILTFEYRNSTINPDTGRRYILDDTMMNARYNGYALYLKALAFVPSVAVFLVFAVMVIIYGRRPKPTKENPYGGRLRKRRRKRFSARKHWNSIRRFFTGPGPILTRFRQGRDQGGGGEPGVDATDGGERGDVETRIGGGDETKVEDRAKGKKGAEKPKITTDV